MSKAAIDIRAMTRDERLSLLEELWESLRSSPGDVPLTEVIQPTRWASLELAPSSPQLAGAEIELVEMRGRETKLRAALRPVRDRYDYVFVDCPPSLGLLTVNALAAAHGVIVPVQCEYLALEGLTQLMTTISLVRRSLNPSLPRSPASTTGP